jgi:hypothetical protein
MVFSIFHVCFFFVKKNVLKKNLIQSEGGLNHHYPEWPFDHDEHASWRFLFVLAAVPHGNILIGLVAAPHGNIYFASLPRLFRQYHHLFGLTAAPIQQY